MALLALLNRLMALLALLSRLRIKDLKIIDMTPDAGQMLHRVKLQVL